jgi:hypothetical protein
MAQRSFLFMEPTECNCQHCDTPFIKKKADKIYCSYACGLKAASKRKHEFFKSVMKQDRTCEWCEQQFSPFFYLGTKQRFCSTKCKDEHHKSLKRDATKQKLSQNPVNCDYCECEFVPTRTGQQFCSTQCKTDKHAAEQRAKRDEHRKQIVRQCPICDSSFSPKKSLKEIYCSKRCRECVGKKIYKMMQSCYEATATEKADHAHHVLGYSPKQLLEHLQTFPQWERLKRDSWHLDHIFPIIAFVRKGIKDLSVICRLDNLQPLPGPKNCSKGDNYDEAEFEKWLKK